MTLYSFWCKSGLDKYFGFDPCAVFDGALFNSAVSFSEVT
jgi:hypothetical protein